MSKRLPTTPITLSRIVAFTLTCLASLLFLQWLPIDEERALGLTAGTLAREELFPAVAEAWSELQPDEQTPLAVRLSWDGSERVLAELRDAAGDSFELTVDSDHPVLTLRSAVVDSHLSLEASLEGLDTELAGERRIADWRSMLPPLFAILVALFFRRLLVAMLGAIVLGSLLHFTGNPLVNLLSGAETYLLGEVRQTFNLQIIGFTFALVGMVMVSTRAGGSRGLIDLVGRVAKSARSTRLATALMGLVIFFDDYANTIVVGTTARPMTDDRRIPREKLAYIVDSTAAPVAGLAVISTWIAFELGLLQPLIGQLHLQLEPGRETNAYAMFISMIPLRFYCLTALLFVFANVLICRDFGPMLAAERRAASTGLVLSETARPLTSKTISKIAAEPGIPHRWINAVLPILVVVLAVVVGMLWSGRAAVEDSLGGFSVLSLESWKVAFGEADSGAVLLISALIGSAVAMLLPVVQRLMKPIPTLLTWLSGIPAMGLAVSILLCAWAIRSVCSDLGTSVFLVSAIGESIPVLFFPLFTFLLSAAVAFSTGTSWGTMGILLPVILPWAHTLSSGSEDSVIIVLLSAAAVLDGAIMGDHCSPISDTTVMSSIATSCDHLDHVRTQIPYALTCMLLAGLGYLLLAAGAPLWAVYGLVLGLIVSVLYLLGRRAEVESEGSAD